MSPAVTALCQSAVIVCAAAVLCFPMLRVGIPEAGDAWTHVMYQYYFSQQFWAGDFYPRWLAGANKGYGTPIFLIQYPFPYFVAALLRPITYFAANTARETRELGVYCFLVLAAAGLAARAWFRNRCTPLASTIAAIVYMSLPYIVGQTLYTRVSLGEAAVFIWMPLIFALCDRIYPVRLSVLTAIGVVFALLVLSNVLTAALFAPVIILYTLAGREQSNSSPVLRAACLLTSFVIAVGVAAAYVFPLMVTRRLFDADAVPRDHPYAELGRQLLNVFPDDLSANKIILPGIVVSAGLMLVVVLCIWRAGTARPGRLLMLATIFLGASMLIPGLGTKLMEWSHLKISGFASYFGFSAKMLFTALFTLALGFIGYCRLSSGRNGRRECLLLMISCGVFILMLPWAAPIWKTFPAFGSVIQFSWRLCAILTVTAAGLFAGALDDCLRDRPVAYRKPVLVALLVLAFVVVVGGNLVWRVDNMLRSHSSPQVDITRGVDPMYDTYVPLDKLAAFAKSVGTSPNGFEVAPTPPAQGIRASITSGQGSVSVIPAGPRRLLVSVQTAAGASVQIGQLYFRLWKVAATQSESSISLRSSPDDFVEATVGPGTHKFWLVFDGGWPEQCGDVVTLLSVVFSVAVFVWSIFSAKKRSSSVAEQPVSS